VWESARMAQTVCVLVSKADKRRLEAIAADRNCQRKHLERAEVILAFVDGGPVQQIAMPSRSPAQSETARKADRRHRGRGRRRLMTIRTPARMPQIGSGAA